MNAISVRGLSKKYGQTLVVNDLNFDVRAGAVTGFLGRNGAGKTTTLRMILGLANPTAGQADIKGKPYAEIENPWTVVGTVLDCNSFHPGRTGRNHLRWVAAATGVSISRVDEVLALVELTGAENKRVKGYSLGMRQRLALATALLGDPEILILDEPANGLDPQGMRWLRDFLIAQAQKGTAVLVSSHVLAELAQFANDIIVIDKGKMVKQGTLAEITRSQERVVRVSAPEASKLSAALVELGATVDQTSETELIVKDMTLSEVGENALKAGIAVHSLNEETDSLEEAFLRLTSDQKDKEVIA
jgi:ABC-2 type transport system ATP-binding protein